MRAPRSIPALAAALAVLAATPASAQAFTEAHFAAVMDQVFGRGGWRMTGGYRTPERENQLRAQGAMTVRPGGLSRHSLGRPGAPGAYDLVVNGMSPFEAADRLRRAGAPFARYQPKGAHGTQGPHLHLEPYGFGPTPGGGFQVASAPAPKAEDGRRRSITITMPAAGPRRLADAREDLRRLHAAAGAGAADAQLELGRSYLLGYAVARDFGEAYAWLSAAADNPAAGPETRTEAISTLAQLPALMEADEAGAPARYADLRSGDAGR
ncbi:MAG: hypothetical protein JNK30_05565 [Phenylobacterium sp.]|uniref:hypothetical protein n=1 Tax=Phenylobacterium sp. TaxID=1871053 RepID=UPI001A5E053A|nr:hypothetical protein [Phenylobacterium sp.]MBL8770831.1 hypothetical protein [Phenylobacterium sp.]